MALSQQLNPDNVAAARFARGSRYDLVTRSNTPVLEFRQRKTLSVFLATPPWQLNAGESLPLKLQIRSAHPISKVSWQGDTQALSLTPGADPNDPQGWSIIMPAWDASPEANNSYRLSVTLEDSKQNRVTSNWITLQVQPPVMLEQGAKPLRPAGAIISAAPRKRAAGAALCCILSRHLPGCHEGKSSSELVHQTDRGNIVGFQAQRVVIFQQVDAVFAVDRHVLVEVVGGTHGRVFEQPASPTFSIFLPFELT